MRLKPRFSLRSLLLAVLFLAASVTLWWNFDPWRVERDLRNFDREVDSLKFSPDGKWAVAETRRGTPSSETASYRCVLWNLQTGHSVDIAKDIWLVDPNRPGGWQLLSEFSGSSKILVANAYAGVYAYFKIWDLDTQTERVIPGLSPTEVATSDIGPDGRTLACMMKDDSVQLFDLETSGHIATIPGVDGILFPRMSNELLALSCNDGSIRVLECTTGREKRRIAPPIDWEFGRVLFLSNDILLVFARLTEHDWGDVEPDMIVRYELRDELPFEIFPGPLHSASKDGALGAVRSGSNINIMDLRNRQILSQVPTSNRGEYFVWLRDDTQMFDIFNGALYATSTGRLIFQISDFNTSRISPDGSRILAECGYKSYAYLIDSESGDVLQSFPHQRIIDWDLDAFSKDSQAFVTRDDSTFALRLYRRHRPEYWYGLAWLPEFWITLALTAALGWSLHCDRRDRRAEKADHAP